MKFIANSFAVLIVLALALGGVVYNAVSAHAKQGEPLTLPKPNLKSEARTITNDIDKIVLDAPVDVSITQGDKASLELKTDARLLSKIVTEQNGRTLRISTKGLLLTMNQPIKISMVLPKLVEIVQQGSGDMIVSGFNQPNITLQSSGSGDVKVTGQYLQVVAAVNGSGEMDINSGTSDKVSITASGSGDVSAIAKAAAVTVVHTGSGDLDAQRLIAQKAQVECHGSGNVKVYASQSVHLNQTGSGDVEIYGNPNTREVSRSGSGEVTYD
ncbi:head GIN domain-containing protein [Sapientia aquatica]|uniref:DUF2807 domain-containing protein n=1 Tax=Sapientia aquatica TaxID=1549640 RepID=A0A4V3AUV6_9BURK|nr:head GIN domain-containing protein [Sapientia aquatica]TDK66650.1 DUF2807 domain-containing protein [Sapientia aquatica]